MVNEEMTVIVPHNSQLLIDNKPVDPKEVERQLLEQAQKEFANANPEDVAAKFFELYFPLFKAHLSGLSNKDARRVAEHLVFWPREEHPKFNDKRANEAFQIGLRLLDCNRIIANVMNLQALQEQQEAQASKIEGEKDGKVET
jgi:hypothetical protein